MVGTYIVAVKLPGLAPKLVSAVSVLASGAVGQVAGASSLASSQLSVVAGPSMLGTASFGAVAGLPHACSSVTSMAVSTDKKRFTTPLCHAVSSLSNCIW